MVTEVGTNKPIRKNSPFIFAEQEPSCARPPGLDRLLSGALIISDTGFVRVFRSTFHVGNVLWNCGTVEERFRFGEVAKAISEVLQHLSPLLEIEIALVHEVLQRKRPTNPRVNQRRWADQRAGVRSATSDNVRRFNPGSTFAR
jgi:hypothetical protein